MLNARDDGRTHVQVNGRRPAGRVFFSSLAIIGQHPNAASDDCCTERFPVLLMRRVVAATDCG